jgi:hypothetical protein
MASSAPLSRVTKAKPRALQEDEGEHKQQQDMRRLGQREDIYAEDPMEYYDIRRRMLERGKVDDKYMHPCKGCSQKRNARQQGSWESAGAERTEPIAACTHARPRAQKTADADLPVSRSLGMKASCTLPYLPQVK